MIRAALLTAILCLSACASSLDTEPKSYSGFLINEPDNQTRDQIRAFVQATLGPDYIADLSRITKGAGVVARDRGRDMAMGGASLREERLFSVRGSDQPDSNCWLELDGNPDVRFPLPGVPCDVIIPT